MKHPTNNSDYPKANLLKSYYDEYVLNMSEANTARTYQRVSAVLEMIGGNYEGRLLSIGAGNLTEPQLFQAAGFQVTVADIAETQFATAEELGLTAHLVDIQHNSVPGKYDVVCCLEVLEHLIDPLRALENISVSVSNHGKLFVSLPEEFHIVSRAKILIGRPTFSHYDWPHLRFFTFDSALELFNDAKFEVEQIRHMSLLPPRWRYCQRLGQLLAALMPSLFSLSHLYELSRP